MSYTGHKDESDSRRRRYLVHLFCVLESEGGPCRYVAQIRPWTGRNTDVADTQERVFADDSELIATVNPLLPPGSDVRDIFGLIETPNGFYYLLRLSNDEAGRLGWTFRP